MNTQQRPFGFWTAAALVVGGMIGSGIFMLPGAMAAIGAFGTVGWIISISGVLSITWVLGRMVRAMPQSTGAIAITGEVLGTLPGVLVGWTFWVSTWTTNAAISIAGISYLSMLLPWLDTTPFAGALAAVALIWLLTLLNIGGAQGAGRFQVVTTLLKLIPLAVVVAIVIVVVLTDRSVVVAAEAAAAPALGFAALTAAVTLTMYPLLGFEAASIAAERVRDPARNIMRASMAGTALTGLIYIIVCSGIVLLMPRDVLEASSAPVALFVGTYVGAGSALVIAAFAAISAIGALNGWVLIVGEVPLGMARAGLLPRWFAKVNSCDVPVRVLVLSAVLASVLVLSNASQSLGGLFRFIALLTTCAALWFYLAICAAALKRRIAVIPAAWGLVFTLWAMWGAGIEASGLSALLMLAGIPVYWLRSRVRQVTQNKIS